MFFIIIFAWKTCLLLSCSGQKAHGTEKCGCWVSDVFYYRLLLHTNFNWKYIHNNKEVLFCKSWLSGFLFLWRKTKNSQQHVRIQVKVNPSSSFWFGSNWVYMTDKSDLFWKSWCRPVGAPQITSTDITWSLCSIWQLKL